MGINASTSPFPLSSLKEKKREMDEGIKDWDCPFWAKAYEDKAINDPSRSHEGGENTSVNKYRIGVFCPSVGGWGVVGGERDGKIYGFCRFQETEVTSPAPPNIFSCPCEMISELL